MPSFPDGHAAAGAKTSCPATRDRRVKPDKRARARAGPAPHREESMLQVPAVGKSAKGSAARREIGTSQSWLRSSSASRATSCAIELSHGERAEGGSCGRRRERRRDRGERSGEMLRRSGSGSGEALRCSFSFCDNHPRCQGPPQRGAKADRLSDKKSDG